MGVPPSNYSNKTLLEEPVEKKPVLPVQGGGAIETVYKGIENSGIDCYINSSIQFLYSVVPFRKLILESDIANLPENVATAATDSQLKRQGLLALQNLFNTYATADKIDIRKLPGPIDNAFDPIIRLGGLDDKGNPRIDPFRQQDVHELINAIFDSLKIFVNPKELERFEHFYRRTLLCKDDETRELGDPRGSSVIILPMKGDSMQELLTNSQESKILDDTNNKIDACISEKDPTGLGISTKDIYDVSTTEYLMLLLQRYSSDGNKINTPIKINKIVSIGERNYEIIGSILHMGGTGGGHYIYNVYDDGSLAITLNDEAQTKFSETSIGPFVKGNVDKLGYMFLYKYTDKEPVVEVEEEKSKGSESKDSETQGSEATIKISGFRVRNPEAAKDEIRELHFTQSEELLFSRIGFDKPFIRKYIILPEGTKEESDASKDAFFKFWKTYVLMDGTSQFSLMTKKESQEVQQYMRDILDAYRKYLSESALQLLFHTSGKPYEPTLENTSTNSFVFTKQAKPGKTQDHKDISKAVKDLMEAVASAHELDFQAYRISIARAKTLTTIKAGYTGLKSDIATLVEQAKKAIAAGVVASLDTSDTLTTVTDIEGFKFTPGEDPEDFIKAANDLISLANKLLKKLDALENVAREFAVIVEVEVEGDNNSNDGSTYVSEDESDDNSDDDSDGDSDDGLDEEEEEGNNTNSLESVNRPTNLLTEKERELKKLNYKLNRLLEDFHKIIEKKRDGKLDSNETIKKIILLISSYLPDDFGHTLRIFMGNPPKNSGLLIDASKPKAAPETFINDYLLEKGRHEKEPHILIKWIINNLIKLDIRKLKEIKGDLIKFFKDKILVREIITANRPRILKYIDPHATP